MAEDHVVQNSENPIIAFIGWGGLGIFALWFAYQVGAPLVMQERWADKGKVAIELVKNQKPTGGDTLYDLIRAYSLKAKDKNIFVGEFSWSAIQKDGPDYDVKLLWTEGSQKRVAIWQTNLQSNQITPKNKGEASTLATHVTSEPQLQKAS